jgi:hypothetical protein
MGVYSKKVSPAQTAATLSGVEDQADGSAPGEARKNRLGNSGDHDASCDKSQRPV